MAAMCSASLLATEEGWNALLFHVKTNYNPLSVTAELAASSFCLSSQKAATNSAATVRRLKLAFG